jgi:hypothetical protein
MNQIVTNKYWINNKLKKQMKNIQDIEKVIIAKW